MLAVAVVLGVGFAWAVGWFGPTEAWARQYAAAEAMCERVVAGQVGPVRVVSARTSHVRGKPGLLATRMVVEVGAWRSTWDCQYDTLLMLPGSLPTAR